MYRDNPFPILEFDEAITAKLNPSNFASERFDTDRMVITFFPEVVEKLKREGRIALERVIPGENPIEIHRFEPERDVLITLGQIGCPACAGNLDLFWGMGIRRVMFCGGGGVLNRDIDVGRLLLVEGAIRDEGFSYHYMPPSRVIYTDPAFTDPANGDYSLKEGSPVFTQIPGFEPLPLEEIGRQ